MRANKSLASKNIIRQDSALELLYSTYHTVIEYSDLTKSKITKQSNQQQKQHQHETMTIRLIQLFLIAASSMPYAALGTSEPDMYYRLPECLLEVPVLIANAYAGRYLFQDGSTIDANNRGAEGGWGNSPIMQGTDENYYNRALFLIHQNGDNDEYIIENLETKRFAFSVGMKSNTPVGRNMAGRKVLALRLLLLSVSMPTIMAVPFGTLNSMANTTCWSTNVPDGTCFRTVLPSKGIVETSKVGWPVQGMRRQRSRERMTTTTTELFGQSTGPKHTLARAN